MDTIALTRGAPPDWAVPSQDQLAVRLDPAEWIQVMLYGEDVPRLKRWIAAANGVGPEDVFVSNGSLQILDLVAGLLPGAARVITEAPTYDRALKTFARHGLAVHGVRVQQDGIDIHELQDALVGHGGSCLLYLQPDFQNPTGATLSLEKRKRIALFCEAHNVTVIEDVPYRQLRYSGEELPLLRTLAPGHVLTLSSFSKVITPGLRVGYATGPADMVEKLGQRAVDVYLSPVRVTQAQVASFVERGLLEPHVSWLQGMYGERCEAAVAAARDLLPDAELFVPEGGFFLGLKLPKNAGTRGLLERARDAGLLLTPGRDFFPPAWKRRNAATRFVRFPFVALGPEEIREGVRRLASLI